MQASWTILSNSAVVTPTSQARAASSKTSRPSYESNSDLCLFFKENKNILKYKRKFEVLYKTAFCKHKCKEKNEKHILSYLVTLIPCKQLACLPFLHHPEFLLELNLELIARLWTNH